MSKSKEDRFVELFISAWEQVLKTEEGLKEYEMLKKVLDHE